MKTAKTLRQYIDDNYKGVVRQYAMQEGFERSMVFRWLKLGAYVIEGHERPFIPSPEKGLRK